MKYNPDDEVTITYVPERAAMYGVSSGMPGVVIRGNSDDTELCKVLIGTCQFWWHPDHMQPISENRIANTQFAAPLGPDMNSFVYHLRELFKIEDEYGCGFYNHMAWLNHYIELRKLTAMLPKDWPERTL